MRIFHTADIHFNNKAQLLADIVKCGSYVIDQAIQIRPDLIVIAGDLFDEGVQLGSPASLAAIDFVYRCGNVAPTILVRGTTTHDAEGSIDTLNKLKTLYQVYATDRIEQVILSDGAFYPMNDLEDPACRHERASVATAIISCLPSVNKANLMSTMSGSVTDTSRETIDLVRDILQGWGVINARTNVPTVLVGHGTVTGSMLSTGQTMAGKDLEYTTGDLRLAACDLYCLGHIHKRQEWDGSIFYSGSITRLNFGEAEEKGFYIHDIAQGALSSRFVETPARSMRTKRPEGLPTVDTVADVQQGELVRIVYEIAEADVGKVDEQAIIDAAMAAGAAEVKIEKQIIPTIRVRAEGISRLGSLEDKLLKWGETTGVGVTKGIGEKLVLLEQIEDPQSIIEDLYEGRDNNAANSAAA